MLKECLEKIRGKMGLFIGDYDVSSRLDKRCQRLHLYAQETQMNASPFCTYIICKMNKSL